ncbi:histidine--tRNA ligase [Botrimarina hoheduenensis]|uniref:Histidine--tRNA ligase n=1 Tax=Botrimarina hoheduenensis TaxID=2528000 RepID=A0A5C5W7U1_9BACT|nr:histidine--tRNA ligase [Botrimarina hoheduenensis]TWT46517.1 Histidine--tRNA ligase [Botrimarina hoheduenensis]
MSKQDRITPRTLKGFRDYPPELALPRERIIETARHVYRSFGYAPIDTPALEYLEILTGKGSEETDKQLYRFTDHGSREVGMRFDLTVPLARFAAQYAQQLGLPFKRYHIASVWRGENPQKGRYREFMQADFDTVGSTGVASDIETVVVLHTLLRACGFERFAIRINHRGVLDGVLDKAGLAGRSAPVLRALDKLAKIGPEKVAEDLKQTAEASATQIDAVLQFASLTGENATLLAEIQRLVAGNATGEAGLERLRETLTGVAASQIDPGGEAAVRIDPAIARGLDYYTGLVLETLLTDLPGIGSVASGGRYDNLAGLYTSQSLPGIGASLGVDRLLAAMEELGQTGAARTPADVLIVYFAEDRLADYLRLSATLRAQGIATELYPEPKKLAKQLQYADKRGFRVALIAGPDELARDECQLKHLATSEAISTPLADVVTTVRRLLDSI